MVPRTRSHWLTRLLLWAFRRLFWLRYRVELSGLAEVAARGRTGILFLPNHPALIDPIMLLLWLYPDFRPRSVADAVQVDRPFMGWVAKRFGARILPTLSRDGTSGVDPMRQALAETIAGLQQGENLLLYPAGHLKRRAAEEIGGASAVRTILDAVPDVRVVLIRQNGLWGSSFSWGFDGQMPRLVKSLMRGLKYVLLNGVFFMPRRVVRVEVIELEAFPRDADRLTLNRHLEGFYNTGAAANTYVPYGFWERGGVRELPDPPAPRLEADVGSVPAATRQIVETKIASLIGRADFSLTDTLGADLGLDSLSAAELSVWVEQEFGFHVDSPESLKTVGDVVVAAAGRGVSAAEVAIRPASRQWFATRGEERVVLPPGDTITEVFLRAAAKSPRRVVVADQSSGERSYHDLVLTLLLLKPEIERLEGPYVGLMLPASVAAGVFYLACLFAGKTPVMVNYTTGSRSLVQALDRLGVRHVITAQALVDRLATLGFDVSGIADRFVLAEQLRARFGTMRKLAALGRSLVSWRALWQARPPETAVVLFTSGSESVPKAVPLTHRNILANLRDVLSVIYVSERDVFIGMLPPFHSFGISVTTVLPLCSGLRVVYHANPTEAAVLARIVEAYQVTFLIGTPTFLNGIVRVARPGQLDSLRLAVTGAEKCPAAVYEALEQRCPNLTVIEGYGITECSPIVSVNSATAPTRQSIGQLMPSLEGVIVGLESEERLPPGQTGMLLVRGPSIFRGYLMHDGPSPFVTFDGRPWYRTGDLIRQTDTGVLFFEGRLNRFVKLGGEMISLPAIEAALAPHFVAEDDQGPVIAVDAIGDPEAPDVTLFATRQIDRAAVNTLLKSAGLGALHHIRQIVVVDSIPVLGTGKTDYRRLKAQFDRPPV